MGVIPLALRSTHDVRTVNEIFCRHDYEIAGDAASVVVDIGGNVGISALYFLTRHPRNRVHVWEPDPENLPFLEKNVEPFRDRVSIHPRAVAPTAGRASFEAESVGRYGGLSEFHEHPHLPTRRIEVECDAMTDAVQQVRHEDGRVDVIKIDTEGSELALIEALPDDLDGTRVYYEHQGGVRVLDRDSRG